MPSTWTSLLGFAVVIAVIPLALWLLRRTPLAGAGFGLRSIAVLPLGASQRIVTIEVGSGDERRWLVLGVTPQSITALHAMAPHDAAAPPPAAGAPTPFGQLLARLRAPGGGDRGR
jgi:flagellar protein FliO/FliZ